MSEGGATGPLVQLSVLLHSVFLAQLIYIQRRSRHLSEDHLSTLYLKPIKTRPDI